jgi:F-type H+-transporting ATPase subunit delta
MAKQTTILDEPRLVGAVAHTYAQTLFGLAEAQQQAEAIGTELAELVELARNEPQLAALLTSPSIATARRAESIEKIFRGRVSDLLCNFVQVVNRKGRLERLGAMNQAYQDILKERYGQIDVDVYSARPLNDAQAQSIAGKLSEQTGREAILRRHVDPSLIGGLKVRLADRQVDGSIATQLRRIRRQLIDSGREAARHAELDTPEAPQE